MGWVTDASVERGGPDVLSNGALFLALGTAGQRIAATQTYPGVDADLAQLINIGRQRTKRTVKGVR